MQDTVMVELDTPAITLAEDVAAVKAALDGTYTTYVKGGRVLVDVQDADDAVESVRSKLEDAGIPCIVYEWSDGQA